MKHIEIVYGLRNEPTKRVQVFDNTCDLFLLGDNTTSTFTVAFIAYSKQDALIAVFTKRKW